MRTEIAGVYASNNSIASHFLLKPYQLGNKEFVFMQVIGKGGEIDLETMFMPLSYVCDSLQTRGLHNIIFSLKDVFDLTDITFALTIAMAQYLEKKGGEIIFCDANPRIIEGMELLEVDSLLKFYLSEEEMVNSEKARSL